MTEHNSFYTFSGSRKPAVIAIMGPTASGKTSLALQLAEHIPCDIISVDSALVYRGLDIGSAKPGAEDRLRVPHKLIDIRDPDQPYSAADFRRDCLAEIQGSIARGRVPLLVGGTMLYFKSLVDGLAQLPAADRELRESLAGEAKKNGWPYLHSRLKKFDPLAAERIHENDSQRIQRALEVYQLTGRTLTELRKSRDQNNVAGEGFKDTFDFKAISLAPNQRSILHERIRDRFLQMLSDGLIDEVRILFEKYDNNMNLPAMRAVGYRQVWSYLSGELCYEEMVEKGIIATRQLAKRQLTWLRAWQGLCWFEGSEDDLLDRVLLLLPLQKKNIN